MNVATHPFTCYIDVTIKLFRDSVQLFVLEIIPPLQLISVNPHPQLLKCVFCFLLNISSIC